jgi:3-vinyl bacteriochlorophyllide hydratase
MAITEGGAIRIYDAMKEVSMAGSGEVARIRARRAASVWTKIHPIFAIGQLFSFFVSVGYLIAFYRGAVDFHVVHLTVLIKIALMIGAVITGALWERDVFGYYWFAPEFLFEDVMTLIVFITQAGYLAAAYSHPDRTQFLAAFISVAYVIYIANVAQYVYRTHRMKVDGPQAELDVAA